MLLSASVPQSVSIGYPSACQQSLLHSGPQLLLCHILFTPGTEAMFDLVVEKPKRESQKHTTHNTDMGGERKKPFSNRLELIWSKEKRRFTKQRTFCSTFVYSYGANSGRHKHTKNTSREQELILKARRHVCVGDAYNETRLFKRPDVSIQETVCLFQLRMFY